MSSADCADPFDDVVLGDALCWYELSAWPDGICDGEISSKRPRALPKHIDGNDEDQDGEHRLEQTSLS
jgi:hypothetical protein